jgi:hypothetical protein
MIDIAVKWAKYKDTIRAAICAVRLTYEVGTKAADYAVGLNMKTSLELLTVLLG